MTTETATLAPASGAGIGKILADRLLAEPDFVDSMIAAVMNGLRATRQYWIKGPGGSELITEPDSKIQLQAFMLVLAHMEGEPIKRIVHQHLGGSGQIDPLAALQESPALRDAARRLLEKSEWQQSGRRSEPKQADTEALEVS